MLVLSRKQDQTIVIDGNIRIKMLRVKGGVVRLGIEAPRHVPILRAEIDRFDTEHFEGRDVSLEGVARTGDIVEIGAMI